MGIIQPAVSRLSTCVTAWGDSSSKLNCFRIWSVNAAKREGESDKKEKYFSLFK